MTIYCCYQFAQDENISLISFKRFLEDGESIYPDLTFCVPTQVNETALIEIDKEINANLYSQFLNGLYWDERFLKIDPIDVSLNPNSYIIETCARSTHFGSSLLGTCREIEITIINQLFHFGFQCYSLHFSKDTQVITTATVKIKASIFPNGIRPSTGEFIVVFQYPNMIFRGLISLFDDWPLHRNISLTDHYRMKFILKGMDVLRRRYKDDEPCHDLKDYDAKVLEELMETVGCRPPHINYSKINLVCSTPQEHQRFLHLHQGKFSRHAETKTHIPPCLEIQKTLIDYVEEQINVANVETKVILPPENWFEIKFVIKTDTFKEIKQVKAYTIQSLVGNVGGYLGLFLGCSLSQLPSLLLSVYNKMKRVWVKLIENGTRMADNKSPSWKPNETSQRRRKSCYTCHVTKQQRKFKHKIKNFN